MFNPDNYDTVRFFLHFKIRSCPNILEFNQCLINGKHGQGTLSTKISADKSPENTPIAKTYLPKIVCPSPRVWDFDEKRLHWASVVRAALHAKILHNSQVFLNKAKNWGCHAENTQLGAKKILCLLFDEKLSSLLLHTSWIIIDAKLFQLKWSSLQACTLEFRIDDSSE